MADVREMLEKSKGKEKYIIAIRYMEERGIKFTPESYAHQKEKYRIMLGDSSVHIRDNYFKFFCTAKDAEKIKEKAEIMSEKNVTKKTEDKVRPHAFKKVSLDDFFKIVDCLLENPLNRNEAMEKNAIEEVAKEEIANIDDVDKVVGEERESIIKTRVNQSKIRNNALKKYHGKCVLCGIGVTTVLRASHIKGWAESNADEKGDHENVLLLCANHDALFDKHLISFAEDGRLLINKEISEEERCRLNISEEMEIEMSEKMKKYMAFHREEFEQKNN